VGGEIVKTTYALHTGFALVEPLKPLYAELLPGVRVVTVVDDGLLADVRAAGGLTPEVTRRLCGYGMLAESSGADAILNCCSSVGEAADVLRGLVSIPVVKIDEAMAERAITLGRRIAVLATVETTLAPTARLIEKKAEGAGADVEARTYLAEGAFDALMSGDAAMHDRILTEQAERAAAENDVVVLAQGSMARLVARLEGQLNVPVLSSPRSGVERLARVLGVA
jgi:Asp/Glu/hydantoin racemase